MARAPIGKHGRDHRVPGTWGHDDPGGHDPIPGVPIYDNGTWITTEGGIDFEDTGSVAWTVTDDPTNSRTKIKANATAGADAMAIGNGTLGVKAQTFPIQQVTSAGALGTGGGSSSNCEMYLQLFEQGLSAGTTLTGLLLGLNTAASGAGPSFVEWGLVDPFSLTVLAVSNNLNASVSAVGLKTIPFTAPVTLTGDMTPFLVGYQKGSWPTTQAAWLSSGGAFASFTTSAYVFPSGARVGYSAVGTTGLPTTGLSIGLGLSGSTWQTNEGRPPFWAAIY